MANSMTTTRKRDRFFALMGALLFLISASALTIAVVWDSVTNKNKTNPNTSQQTTCTIAPVAGVAEKLPANYQKTADTTKSLETEDLTVGTGATAKAGDCLVVKYYGTLATNGKLFDQDYDQAAALQFELGAGQVIPGWDQGLVGMKEGGVRRLVIPSDLAYGDAGQGSIPAKATLVFLVKLQSIK